MKTRVRNLAGLLLAMCLACGCLGCPPVRATANVPIASPQTDLLVDAPTSQPTTNSGDQRGGEGDRSLTINVGAISLSGSTLAMIALCTSGVVGLWLAVKSGLLAVKGVKAIRRRRASRGERRRPCDTETQRS
jgi:hypothetical protein